MYQIHFLLLNGEHAIIANWVNSNRFPTKEDAMRFAQNTAKSFNGSCYNIFYRVVG